MSAGDPIWIQSVGDTVPLEFLDSLAARLARVFGRSCRVLGPSLDPAPFYDPDRGQYWSTAILRHLAARFSDAPARVLGVADVDLFVPVLTFVFGEAQLEGRCAVISLCRLREEFYGLPPNPERLLERAVKEAVHELGHTFGLRHCRDWRCVMASTHAVERLDLKEADFCPACRRVVDTAGGFSADAR
ncbi:MAG: archaemetzincin family Zn-dependent metalloprotease [Bryobacterales bacterium]|nr:archaemetzincin family Zn-dependent metalloprotease [Bryobacterales bacterium]